MKLRTAALFILGAVGISSAFGQDRREIDRKRVEWFNQVRAYPRKAVPPGSRLEALKQRESMRPRGAQAAKAEGVRAAVGAPDTWTLIGPRSETVLLTPPYGPPVAAGRVSALAVDPRNSDVAYLGGASGGVWKTADGGRNWTPLTDNQPSLAVGSIAIAPSNPDVIYVGTGEQNFSGDSYYGAGVLKSSDAGVTWTQMPGAFVGPFSGTFSGGGYRLGAIAVHPANENIVLTGGSRETPGASGIFRSIDGGTTWSSVLTGSAGTEIVFDPTDGNVAYAALGRGTGDLKYGIYKSLDAGATWTAFNGAGVNSLPVTGGGRIAMAISPSSPNVLYVSMAANNGLLRGVFKTVDGARNWAPLLSAPDYCAPQCGYDNVIRVHPKSPNVVVAAGDAFGLFQSSGIYRTLNGGNTWVSIFLGANGIAPHSDHHALAFSGTGDRLYAGNDGGVYSTDDVSQGPVSWNNLNDTLAITSMSSGFAIDPVNPKLTYAGTQDNGTLKYTGNLQWDQVFGGDGEQAQVDFARAAVVYVTTPGSSIFKITDQGNFQDYVRVVNGIDRADRVGFTGAFTIDPSNPDRLYFGTYRVYQTTDGAGLWKAISPDLTVPSQTAVVTAVAVAPSNSNVVYAGTSNQHVQVTTNALDGTRAAWDDRSNGLPNRSVSSISVDPIQPMTAYATFSGFSGFGGDTQGHVFKTLDGGVTWTDVSGNMPNIPANDLVIDPDVAGTLYLGTDIGVFRTTDGGETWSVLSSGFPNTVVSGLKLHRPSRTLRAATHGRSMWDLRLPLSTPSLAPTVTSASPNTINSGGPNFTITLTGTNFLPTSSIRFNGVDLRTTFVSSTQLQAVIPASNTSLAGRAVVYVFNPVAGGGNSNPINLVVGPAPVLVSAGVVNSANPLGGSVLVPGSIATIFGANLAAQTEAAGAAPLPATLGGIKVELSGFGPVPLLFVSPNQINFQAPWFIGGFVDATLTVSNGGLTSSAVTVKTANFAPGIYTINGQGSGQGAVLISGSGGTVAAPAGFGASSRPVKKGEYIEIYATGLGDVTNNPPTGGVSPPVPLSITRTPIVTVGGVQARVVFSGLTPGAVGLFQVNLQVPADVPSGRAIPVTIAIGGVVSNTVTIAVE
ncbi:MAG: IPT/TIG domain-containing protein [Acidobacteriota bacterium]|nr:IPT/TIG domain-containing protein [Acidobacteriota bacterium]